jgi:hypothetical protein
MLVPMDIIVEEKFNVYSTKLSEVELLMAQRSRESNSLLLK